MITITLPAWVSVIIITAWTIFSVGLAIMMLGALWVMFFEYPSVFNRGKK
jgi:hypothetical protein